MIGRHREAGILAHVGGGKIARVVVAGLLVAAALAVESLAPGAGWLVVALAVASLALTGLPIVVGALRGLLRLETNVDELVALAIVASVVLGEWIAAAVVAFIMILGSLIEEITAERARRHVERLGSASPDYALLIEDRGETREVEATELRPGQLILVRPGDVVAADGRIEGGESELDESMITGESLPVSKAVGATVSAGTINTHGALEVRVERVGGESVQGRILKIVQEAEQHRAPIIRVAERYAKWFTPGILLLAGAVFLVTWDIQRAVTMLIVGCPCAFVLATPTAVMAALGAASRQGVLIKGGKYLEACAAVDVVVFDKTGTLTRGAFEVVEARAFGEVTADELLARAASLEARAEHPLAAAIVAAARERGLEIDGSVKIRRESGRGVVELAAEGALTWRLGSARFLEESGVALSEAARGALDELAGAGQTVVFLARGAELEGLIALADELREESRAVIEALRRGGVSRVELLSGDGPEATKRVAELVAIAEADARSQRLPEQKYDHVRALEGEGARVCYIGDGTNDGPALSVASVGVSIASRENTVALETADVVLMRDGLQKLPFLIDLGRRTARTINQNLILFGLILNASLLALSAAGLLTPVLGAISHNLGSVAVVLNSARLLRARAQQ
jgi:Zn2+/Cd2+-exporting ATPase